MVLHGRMKTTAVNGTLACYPTHYARACTRAMAESLPRLLGFPEEPIMKAIVVHQYGGPEVLKFEEHPDPVAGPGEVLVKVAASSVNPIDYKRRAGKTQDFYPIKFPGLIGVDVTGTVLTVWPGVEGFRSGERVLAV